MTILEMHTMFDFLMDEANAPWFNAAEKDRLLNRVQADLTRDDYQRFEIDENVRQKLAKLVEVLPVVFTQPVGTSYGLADLDGLVISNAANGSTIMFILSLNVTVTDPCGRIKRRSVKAYHSNDEVQATNDPFNKPSARNPKLHIEYNPTTAARRMRLYVGGDNDTAPLSVIGTPNQIRILRSAATMTSVVPVVDCELATFVHDEIVKRAVTLALEIVESARLQGHSLLSQTE